LDNREIASDTMLGFPSKMLYHLVSDSDHLLE